MEKRELCGVGEERLCGFGEREAMGGCGGVEGERREGRESCRGRGHDLCLRELVRAERERSGRLIPKPEDGSARL